MPRDIPQLWKTLVAPESDQYCLVGSGREPGAIRRIAQTHLKSPEQITVAAKIIRASSVRARLVGQRHA